MGNVLVESYTLTYKEHGGWLAQVLLTSDGMFAAVSDWGNFSYAWRAYGDRTFKEFTLSLDVDYFEDKMSSGMSFVSTGKRVDSACKNFARRVLPVLQEALKKEAQALLKGDAGNGN
jgi:hypothetical protein